MKGNRPYINEVPSDKIDLTKYVLRLNFAWSRFSDDVPSLVGNEVASHFIEQSLAILSKEKYQEILEKFLPKLLKVAIHPVANFVIQKLITNAHDSDQVRLILN